MSLQEKIESEIKTAMRAKDKVRLQALRSIKSQILLAKSEKGAEGDLTAERELQILSKAAKQRKDSLDIYTREGRHDLADVEAAELAIIEEFLPQMLSEDELRAAIQEIIQETGANSPQHMGKVMGAATQKLAGKADNKMIAQIVKQLLTTL
ncbi:MAG: GatB/YqeY domain-containing protein [Bernardetiaceae bacterium]